MNFLLRAGATLCLGIALAPGLKALPPIERSVSSSRQFVVYGVDGGLRSAMCDVAERTKANLLRVLQQPDRWTTPIVVNLQLRAANLPEIPPAQFTVSQTGFGLKLQIDLLVTEDFNTATVQRELLRGVLLEMMYRRDSNLPAGVPYVQPPDWLVDGCLVASPESENRRPTQLLRTLSAAGKTTALRDFLRQRPELLDSPSREIFRAHAYALVELLTESAEGRSRLVQFIADLPQSSNDPFLDLTLHFPFFAGPDEKTEKSWSLGVARIAATAQYQTLGIEQTERELERLLHVRVSESGAEKDYRLEDFAKFIKAPSRAGILTSMSEELLLLGARANPVYHAIVQEYQNIAIQLARGKTERIAKRLARVKSFREGVTDRMREIDDYMNWFEATQLATNSGAFNDYLRTARDSGQPDSRRRDAISVYMDSLEQHFESNSRR